LSRRWLTPSDPSPQAEALAEQFDLPVWIAQCLIHRGQGNPESAAVFLDPRLRRLSDPFLLPNIASAVDRLFQQRESNQPLVLFGDYDVDGVTATTILKQGLEQLGWIVHHYLPRRMEEGYGLSQQGVETCLGRYPVSLLVAVDCGSTAVDPIAWLNGRGVDVLVLDHHQVSTPLPAAFALVNPQLGETGTPSFRELCSAGVAFKVLHAVMKRGRELGLTGFDTLDLREFLDLVALGTVADLVPLVGENRILVTAGLQRLTETKRPGLVALKEVAGIEGDVGVSEVGFQLGPRLNASGRLETAEASLDLLMARDLETARPLAAALDATNRERQTLEREMSETAVAQVRARFDPARDWVIVEGNANWHLGVVGIVASRVLREFNRPTLILGGDPSQEHWRGSGRSLPGFDLAEALRACSEFLVRHGGHAMAAGVTLSPDQFEAFRSRINEVARERITPEILIPTVRVDAWVTLEELTLSAVECLQRLEPFGTDNPPPQFAIAGVQLAGRPLRMGKTQQHLKLPLTDGVRRVDAVWWNAGEAPIPSGVFDVAVVPQVNEYGGRCSVQLRWLDSRPSTGAR